MRQFKQLFVLISVLLASCLETGSDIPETQPRNNQKSLDTTEFDDRVISGSVVKGLLKNATVLVYAVEAGQPANLLAETQTSETGQYSVLVGSEWSGDILIRVISNAKTMMVCDALDGCGSVPWGESFPIESLVLDATGVLDAPSESIHVNMLTHLSTQLAQKSLSGGISKDNIAVANSQIENLFGLEEGSIKATEPVDITAIDPAILTEEALYNNLVNAAFASISMNATSFSESVANLSDAFANRSGQLFLNSKQETQAATGVTLAQLMETTEATAQYLNETLVSSQQMSRVETRISSMLDKALSAEPATLSNAVPKPSYLEERIQLSVDQTNILNRCVLCHSASGLAATSGFILDNASEDTLMLTLTQYVNSPSGTKQLLAKATNQNQDHGGGAQIAEKSSEYDSLSALLVAIAAPPEVNIRPNANISNTVNTRGVAPLTVAFDASASTDDNKIVHYWWKFGEGLNNNEGGDVRSVNGISVIHTYEKPGTYIAELTVEDEAGLKHTQGILIEVLEPEMSLEPMNQLPVALLTADKTTGVAPLTVLLDAANSTDEDGVLNRYQWDFGNGETDEGLKTAYIFDQVGTYTITLTVYDDQGGTDSESLNIQVLAPEVPVIVPVKPVVVDATNNIGRVPLTVAFEVGGETSGDVSDSYRWDFGEGTLVDNAGTTISHTYTQAGNYTVTVIRNDDENRNGENTGTVNVIALENQFPIANASNSTQTSGRAPTPHRVHFNGLASTDDEGVVSYQWDFGDGNTANGAVVSHDYNVGTYSAILTVTDAGGLSSTVTLPIKIELNAAPVANLDESVITEGSAPLVVSFDASASTDDTEIVSYFWNFGDGQTGVGTTLLHQYEEAGDYTAELIVTDEDGVTDTAVLQISVSNSAVETTAVEYFESLALSVFNQNCTQCHAPNKVAAATALSFSGQPAQDFEMVNAYVLSSKGETSSHRLLDKPTLNGIGHAGGRIFQITDPEYTVLATLVAKITAENVEEVINDQPMAAFTQSVTNGVAPLSVTFNAASSTDSDGSISSYHWDFDNNDMASGIEATHTFSQPGTYSVTLTVTDNEGASDTASTVLEVLHPPVSEPPVPQPEEPQEPQEPIGEFLLPVNVKAGSDLPVEFVTDQDIVYVKLFVNGTLVRQENKAPYNWAAGLEDAPLRNLPAGTYTLTAEVLDSGNVLHTVETSVTVEQIEDVNVPTDPEQMPPPQLDDIQAVMALPEIGCTNSGCHEPAAVYASPNLQTGSLEDLAARMVNQKPKNSGCQDELIIDAMNPDNSLLLKLIDPNATEQCMPKMPYGSQLVSGGIPEVYLSYFREWVDDIISASNLSVAPPPLEENPVVQFDLVPGEAFTILNRAKGVLQGGAVIEEELENVQLSDGMVNVEQLNIYLANWLQTEEYQMMLTDFFTTTLQQSTKRDEYFFQKIGGSEDFFINFGRVIGRTAARIATSDQDFREILSTNKFEVTTAALEGFHRLTHNYYNYNSGGYGGVNYTNKDWYKDWRTVELQWQESVSFHKTIFNLDVNSDNRLLTSEALADIPDGGSLEVYAPIFGFFTQPAFFATWQTNQDNQFRVNVSQALIAALGLDFSPVDTTPVNHTEGLDEVHSTPGTECYGCHIYLDPMRNVYTKYFDTITQRAIGYEFQLNRLVENPRERFLHSVFINQLENGEVVVRVFDYVQEYRNAVIYNSNSPGWDQQLEDLLIAKLNGTISMNDFDLLNRLFQDLDHVEKTQRTPDFNKIDFAFRGYTASEPINDPKDFGKAIGEHPEFARAWVLKVCQWALSNRCDNVNPYVDQIVNDIALSFKNSGFRFETLITEFFTSELMTHFDTAANSKWPGNSILVPRRDRFCRSMTTRLRQVMDAKGIVPDKDFDFCSAMDFRGNRVGFEPASFALPNDSHDRGVLHISQQNEMNTFMMQAVHKLCDNSRYLFSEADVVAQGKSTFSKRDSVDSVIDFSVRYILGIPGNHADYDLYVNALNGVYKSINHGVNCENPEDTINPNQEMADGGLTQECGILTEEEVGASPSRSPWYDIRRMVRMACKLPNASVLGL